MHRLRCSFLYMLSHFESNIFKTKAICYLQTLKKFNIEIFLQFTQKTFFATKSFHSIFAPEMEHTKTKEEHTKEEVRNLITEKALELFAEKGIKDVKMDDIAAELSMSKRTIYEQFADKEQLLLEALKLHNRRMRDEAKERIRKAKHVLDIVLTLYSLYFQSLKSINIKFFKELERYPNICKRNRERNNKNDKRFLAWMEMGRKQGLFREDANFEILLYILRRDLETIFTANMRDEQNELSKYTPEELGRTLILFYLRGISTTQGQEIIEEYLKTYRTTK